MSDREVHARTAIPADNAVHAIHAIHADTPCRLVAPLSAPAALRRRRNPRAFEFIPELARPQRVRPEAGATPQNRRWRWPRCIPVGSLPPVSPTVSVSRACTQMARHGARKPGSMTSTSRSASVITGRLIAMTACVPPPTLPAAASVATIAPVSRQRGERPRASSRPDRRRRCAITPDVCAHPFRGSLAHRAVQSPSAASRSDAGRYGSARPRQGSARSARRCAALTRPARFRVWALIGAAR
jgi:hypothetical protein